MFADQFVFKLTLHTRWFYDYSKLSHLFVTTCNDLQ